LTCAGNNVDGQDGAKLFGQHSRGHTRRQQLQDIELCIYGPAAAVGPQSDVCQQVLAMLGPACII
jgi:hypothetical protein